MASRHRTPLRAGVTALARAPAATPKQPSAAEPVGGESRGRSPARDRWAMLLARLYEVFLQVWKHSGTEMRIIIFLTSPALDQRIASEQAVVWLSDDAALACERDLYLHVTSTLA